MEKIKVLVVDDEEQIREMVRTYLENEQFQVVTTGDPLEVEELLSAEKPDLIVLDLMLPGITGLELCSRLRRVSNVPIIMLTAKATQVDKLVGLELGADDYITKPFSLAELTARIRVVLRRAKGEITVASPQVITKGDLVVDLTKYQVSKKGLEISLTPTEFKLLTTLMTNPGRVYSRLQLLESASDDAYIGYERSIDTHIRNLRQKVEEDPSKPQYILTVFGVGYKFAQ